jgi:hypothetical protein
MTDSSDILGAASSHESSSILKITLSRTGTYASLPGLTYTFVFSQRLSDATSYAQSGFSSGLHDE